MHALIVGLFDQLFDPALVVTDMADGLLVVQKTPPPSGNGCPGFPDHRAGAGGAPGKTFSKKKSEKGRVGKEGKSRRAPDH